jgi:MoxR-like ATPase
VAQQVAVSLRNQVNTIVAGRETQVELAAACLLAGGHLLIEDVPGVGKTLLSQAIAASIGGAFRRVQGTADLLPSDILGAMTPDPDGLGLRFRPGPVFANVVVLDELNRASQRTQSALLEVMEEGQVTVDGVTHRVPQPWFVVATQNPLDMVGTYQLGEGVVDRFMAVVSLGRASSDEELAVLTGRRGRSQLTDLTPAVDVAQLHAAQGQVRTLFLDDEVGRYAVAILAALRDHPRTGIGPSTRAGVAMVMLARALAAMAGRDFVAPHDVGVAAVHALPHRLAAVVDGRAAAQQIVLECVRAVPAPRR